MASLPFPEIDVLVVQQLGKNISGTGMDTNVISRLMIPRQPEAFGQIDVAVIAVLDLTEETHGNVAGLGLANITTARVAQKIDWVATYTNCITSGIFGMFRVSLPITLPDDARALQVALRGCATTVCGRTYGVHARYAECRSAVGQPEPTRCSGGASAVDAGG